jgi:hypothetical protein
VGVGHRLAHLGEDAQEPPQVLLRVGPLAQQLGQGVALDQFHREEGLVVGESPQLVDRGDAGMLELPGNLRLLEEAADQLGAIAVFVQQHLDRQFPAELGVASFEDGPHAPAADLVEQQVASRGGCRRRGARAGLRALW